MQILCHRGQWTERSEQNTLAAFHLAWSHGWGVETDLRDLDGGVVVSHDPPRRGALALSDLLAAHRDSGAGTPLALNVKADGLAGPVARELAAHGTSGAFVFDMSVPDALAWHRAAVPAWTRWSDVEPEPLLLGSSAGIWLDAFHDDGWWSADAVGAAVAQRPVCVVSPELHGRDPRGLWDRLAEVPGVWLCTDRPEEVAP